MSIVLDDRAISSLFSQIESLIKTSREQLDEITSKYSELDTYRELVESKKLLMIYGNTADAFSKVCFLSQGVTEAILDVKTIKREIAKDGSGLIPSMVKTYKYRADSLIEQLTDLRDAVNSARVGMDARVRYLSSVSYGSYDKINGAKC